MLGFDRTVVPILQAGNSSSEEDVSGSDENKDREARRERLRNAKS